MPLGDGFFRVQIELLIPGLRLDLHPRRFRAEHQVRVLRWHRQWRVDGRGEWMNQFRPLRAEQPQARAADRTEMPLGAAAVGAFVAFFLEPRMVNRDVLAPAHLEAGGIATEVDRIAATALGLAADRAVATLVRVGVGAGQAERHRAAMAGTLEL